MFKAKRKLISLLTACMALVLMLVMGVVTMSIQPKVASAADTEIVFNLGANGSSSHSDGSEKSSYSETVSGYTLNITGGSKMYTGARDAKGNSCLKLGTSSAVGKFTFTVPNDVASVIFSVGKYKTNTTKVTINGTTTTLTKSSNDGAYDTITVDTTSTKTVSLTTVSGGARAMVNTITFVIPAAAGACEHTNATTATTEATCTTNGIETTTCPDCGEEKTKDIPALGHNYVDIENGIIKEASCTEEGSKKIACVRCGDEKEETLPAMGHDYVDGKCSICKEDAPLDRDLVFDSEGKRTEYSTSKQVWSENGVTLTNNKGSSSSNVADYADPVRFYKSSQIIIECEDKIESIIFYCNTTEYATNLKNSIKNATVTIEEKIVTVKLNTTATNFEITLDGGQVRMDSLTVLLVGCEHANTTTTTTDATCTEDGLETVTCGDCEKIISTTSIPATGHSLDEGTITKQPDVGVEGEKTYTCQNEGCDYTEIESVPALDAETFVVSYSVPKGIDAVENSEAVVSGETVILPTAKAKEGFVFVGWVLTKTVETEVCPEVFSAETEYTVTGDITLYALYSYTTGSGNYVKVTENLADWSGEYLIVYESGENAYIFNAADAVNGYVSATTSGASIVNNEAVSAEAVTLAKMDDGYSILTKNGYIYGTSNNNALNFNSTTAQVNTIVFNEDGTVELISNTSHFRFNNASNQMRFRYYKSASYSSQKAVYLYKLDGATCYTTSLPSIDSASVTLGDDVALNYYVTMSEGLEATMNFTMNGETYDRELTKDGARYKVSLELPPQYMATEISVELIVNGVVVETMTYSIKQYAQSMLNDAGNSDKLKRLVSDMLYYGAAAQVYRGYNVENLATADVTNLVGTPSTVTPEEADNVRMLTSHVADKKASFKSVSVWFDDVNKIYVKVNTQNANGAAVTLKILKGETVEKEVVVTSETVFTEGILATDFDETYTFELSVDGELTQTLTYSVNAYAYKMQTHADMGELALALYRYGKSAEAYKG